MSDFTGTNIIIELQRRSAFNINHTIVDFITVACEITANCLTVEAELSGARRSAQFTGKRNIARQIVVACIWRQACCVIPRLKGNIVVGVSGSGDGNTKAQRFKVCIITAAVNSIPNGISTCVCCSRNG